MHEIADVKVEAVSCFYDSWSNVHYITSVKVKFKELICILAFGSEAIGHSGI